MLRYFVAGNAWLFFGILTILGQTAHGSACSFFGYGFLWRSLYWNVQLGIFVASALNFWGWYATRKRAGLRLVKERLDEIAA